MFWKKPKPPLWKRLWNEARAAIGVAFAVISGITGGIAYIQIDTTSFENTTNVASVVSDGHIYTSITTKVELPEHSYIVLSINGTQTTHNVYPEGIPQGEVLISTPIPFNVEGDFINVEIDIYFIGLRTLFVPQRLHIQIEPTNGGNDASTSSIFNAVASNYSYRR